MTGHQYCYCGTDTSRTSTLVRVSDFCSLAVLAGVYHVYWFYTPPKKKEKKRNFFTLEKRLYYHSRTFFVFIWPFNFDFPFISPLSFFKILYIYFSHSLSYLFPLNDIGWDFLILYSPVSISSKWFLEKIIPVNRQEGTSRSCNAGATEQVRSFFSLLVVWSGRIVNLRSVVTSVRKNGDHMSIVLNISYCCSHRWLRTGTHRLLHILEYIILYTFINNRYRVPYAPVIMKTYESSAWMRFF
jgi:hypothetical protein